MQLAARGLTLITHEGRALVRDLTLQLGPEQVAIVGRNGVGKSTLLRTLAGVRAPEHGELRREGTLRFVPQIVEGDASGGELRTAALHAAFAAEPDFLLLDEPTNDLDTASRGWLLHRLRSWRRGLVVVSHDPEVLAGFRDFFVIEERGCRHLSGTWEQVEAELDADALRAEERYAAGLRHQAQRARHHRAIQRRRERKRNVGRIHELDRSQSRLRLNTRRAAAQVSQAKVGARQQARIDEDARWARALQRALRVALPLELAVPAVEGAHERIGVVGPNGAGKTTLLESLVGDDPDVGFIDQGATRWRRDEPLTALLEREVGADHAAALLVAHRFPLGLALRPLRTLSPGERTRAALIALFTRPQLRTLVLDEPTWSLDRVGRRALEAALRTWRGGLVVASHDRSFLAPLVDTWVAVEPRAQGSSGASLPP